MSVSIRKSSLYYNRFAVYVAAKHKGENVMLKTNCTIYEIDSQGLITLSFDSIENLEAWGFQPTDEKMELIGWPHSTAKLWVHEALNSLWIGEELGNE